jgi:DNA-binding protein WhiA
MVERNYKSVIYISSGDEISRFLAFIGANKSMLNFEETRVLKEVGNNVNRIVNFETANLNKTISSAVKQIEDIKLIKSKKKFNMLSEGEQELAELRLANPEVNLTKLGELATPQLTKSGVAHRMANITKLAKDLRK